MTVTVVGAAGFVGSAFVRHLAALGVSVRNVTRATYARWAGQASDVVIDAAGNSRKYVAEERPLEEFDASVGHRARTLRDFPARLQLHLSSVDVYADLDSPCTTVEDTPIEPARLSHYGFHKWLAEELVRHHAPEWLIVRMAGMVGPGLRKNPVYDVLHRLPLRIHPDSQYQFLSTDDVARMVWLLVDGGVRREVVNVCGDGVISPREIAVLAGVELELAAGAREGSPRIVTASNRRLKTWVEVPQTRATVGAFVQEWTRTSATMLR
jgi:nucleoside-diphosphate-sugar epimerase